MLWSGMESRKVEINGVEIIAYADGSIEKPFHKRTKRTFGSNNGEGYMRTRIGRSAGTFRLHRVIAKAFISNYSEDVDVDHIDGNKTNNKVENLRMASDLLNTHGFRTKKVGCSSKYIGVSKYKATGQWTASLILNYKRKFLGYFNTEIEAAKVYNDYHLKLGLPKEGVNLI